MCTVTTKLFCTDAPVNLSRSDDPAELGVASTPLAQDITPMEMEMETFGDFDDGVWSPPPEFDDISGSYGEEGATSIHTSNTRTWQVLGFDVKYHKYTVQTRNMVSSSAVRLEQKRAAALPRMPTTRRYIHTMHIHKKSNPMPHGEREGYIWWSCQPSICNLYILGCYYTLMQRCLSCGFQVFSDLGYFVFSCFYLFCLLSLLTPPCCPKMIPSTIR